MCHFTGEPYWYNIAHLCTSSMFDSHLWYHVFTCQLVIYLQLFNVQGFIFFAHLSDFCLRPSRMLTICYATFLVFFLSRWRVYFLHDWIYLTAFWTKSLLASWEGISHMYNSGFIICTMTSHLLQHDISLYFLCFYKFRLMCFLRSSVASLVMVYLTGFTYKIYFWRNDDWFLHTSG